MTSKEALKTLKGYLGTDTKTIELLIPIAKDLEEYEIAKKLIYELDTILYGDDEECKTDFDIIKRCRWKILQYLEDKAKRLGTENSLERK